MKNLYAFTTSSLLCGYLITVSLGLWFGIIVVLELGHAGYPRLWRESLLPGSDEYAGNRSLECNDRKSNILGIRNESWYYGLSRMNTFSKINEKDFLLGHLPRIIGSSACPSAQRRMIQKALDLVSEFPNPRLNPSIISVPASSPLSGLANFIGVVRVSNGLNHFRLNGDEIVFWNATVDLPLGKIESGEERVPRGCDLILLDEKLHTLVQVPILEAGASLRASIEDCRIFFLGPDCSPFITGVRYDPPSFETVTVVQQLSLRIRTTTSQNVPRPLMVVAEISSTDNFPGKINLHDLRIEGNETDGVLMAGKNQLVIESPDGNVYVVNRFHPLEIFHVLDGTTARRVNEKETVINSLLQRFHLNGGKMVYLTESAEYLGMVHIHRDYEPGAGFYGSHYTQAFFTIDSKLTGIKRLGTEFCFRSAQQVRDCEALQFSMGMDQVNNDTLILGYGVGDVEARVLTIRLGDAISGLQSYERYHEYHGENNSDKVKILW